MKILFFSETPLTVRNHIFLIDVLTQRGHSCVLFDTSKYVAVASDSTKLSYLKALSKAPSSIPLDFSFESKGVMGSAFSIARLLKQNEPNCVVVGLDSYLPERRLVINVCKKLKIPVILFQDGNWYYPEDNFIFQRYRPQIQSFSGKNGLFPRFSKTLTSGTFLPKLFRRIDLLTTSFLFGDLRPCYYGCGGADKIGVFSEIERKGLLKLKVPDSSIVVTGSLAFHIDRECLNAERIKKQRESYFSNKKNGLKRLVVISGPLYEVSDKQAQYKVFLSILLAFKEISSLGWQLSIRLHPREEKYYWQAIIDELQLSVQPVIGYDDITWFKEDIVLGFDSTLLPSVVLDRVPLIIYDVQDKFLMQNFDIATMGVCHDSRSLVDILTSYSLPDETKLDRAYEKVKNKYGFNEKVVENSINLIEAFQL